MVLKTFRWAFLLTIMGLVGGFFLGFREGNGIQGAVQAFVLVGILCILEISLSFDNAVVNATILERMSPFWQKIFLTIGIAIAVFGMRLVFPLLVVSITAGIGPVEVIDLALKGGDISQEGSYAYLLHEAHPAIASFGGMFLFMIFMEFIFDNEKEHHWLSWLEKPIGKLGQLGQLGVVVALVVLVIAAQTLTDTRPDHTPATVMIAGVLGTITYILVKDLGDFFESQLEEHEEEAEQEAASAEAGVAASTAESATSGTTESGARKSGPNGMVKATGKAGFFLFLYLEVLDASFSFDGVIGAFAITSDIFVIAIGLGVGAMYIRSLTVYLVRKGTLNDYVYLEHGAMWAIGALAVILLITIKFEVPEVVTGLIGVGFIGFAFLSSIIRNRRLKASGGDGGDRDDDKITAGV